MYVERKSQKRNVPKMYVKKRRFHGLLPLLSSLDTSASLLPVFLSRQLLCLSQKNRDSRFNPAVYLLHSYTQAAENYYKNNATD